MLTIHLLLVPSCEWVGATTPPSICVCTDITWIGLDSEMVYKFSLSVSYSQFKQCVSHWLDDWKIGFESPLWAQIFVFSISSRIDTY